MDDPLVSNKTPLPHFDFEVTSVSTVEDPVSVGKGRRDFLSKNFSNLLLSHLQHSESCVLSEKNVGILCEHRDGPSHHASGDLYHHTLDVS